MKKFLPFLFFTILIFLLYHGILTAPFISDDIPAIVNNSSISQFSNLFPPNVPYFAFIQPLIYIIISRLFGMQPLYFHLVNILFHIGSVICAYFIVQIISNKKVAFFSALLFAVHPLCIESVTWISGGNYVRGGFFFLLSFLLFMKYLNKRKMVFLIISVVSFICSITSLEKMIPLTILFPLYIYIYEKKKLNRNKVFLLLYVLPAFVFFLINISRIPQRMIILSDPSLGSHVSSLPFVYAPQAIGEYIRLFFIPLRLTLYHATPDSFLNIVLFLFFILISIFCITKHPKLGLLCIGIIASLLVTLYSPTISWIVAERYAYLTVFFASTFFVISTYNIAKKYHILSIWIIVCIVFIVLLSVRTVARNQDWTNQEKFWEATEKISPGDFGVHIDLGKVYLENKKYQQAYEQFTTSITLNPRFALAYYYRGDSLIHQGFYDEALTNYMQSIELEPRFTGAYQNIGAIYYQQKKYDQAEYYAKRAIELNPQETKLKINLATIYVDQKRFSEARSILKEILSIEPNNQVAKQGMYIIESQESSKNTNPAE